MTTATESRPRRTSPEFTDLTGFRKARKALRESIIAAHVEAHGYNGQRFRIRAGAFTLEALMPGTNGPWWCPITDNMPDAEDRLRLYAKSADTPVRHRLVAGVPTS